VKKINVKVRAMILDALEDKPLSTHQLHQMVIEKLGDNKYGLTIYMTAHNCIVLKKLGKIIDNQFSNKREWRLL